MSQAELNGELFTLERFPPNAEEEALQAWEAADEYLLQQVNDVDGLTLIFNDGFGADVYKRQLCASASSEVYRCSTG